MNCPECGHEVSEHRDSDGCQVITDHMGQYDVYCRCELGPDDAEFMAVKAQRDELAAALRGLMPENFEIIDVHEGLSYCKFCVETDKNTNKYEYDIDHAPDCPVLVARAALEKVDPK